MTNESSITMKYNWWISVSFFCSKFASHQSRLSHQDQDCENYNFVTSEAKRNFLRSQPSSPCRNGHAPGKQNYQLFLVKPCPKKFLVYFCVSDYYPVEMINIEAYTKVWWCYAWFKWNIWLVEYLVDLVAGSWLINAKIVTFVNSVFYFLLM